MVGAPMARRMFSWVLSLLATVSYATCQNPAAPSPAPLNPLSEPGDPPGLAEHFKKAPRIVERPFDHRSAGNGDLT